MKDHPFLLFRRGESDSFLLTSDPLDGDILASAHITLTSPFTIQVIGEGQLKKLIREHYQLGQQENETAVMLIDEADIDKLKGTASEAPVIKYVNNLIDTAVTRRASDINLEPFGYGLRIRLRIDGILHDYEIPPHAMQPAIISRTKLLAGTGYCRAPPAPGRQDLHAGLGPRDRPAGFPPCPPSSARAW